MKTWKAVTVAVGLSITLTGCMEGNKQGVGTLIGAGLGAWMGKEIGGRGGSGVAGAMIGTIVGASIGNSIGKQLDRADRLAMERAYYDAMEYSPDGQSTTWYNPNTGNHGTYTPQSTYQKYDDSYCREFTQTIYVGGEPQEGYGTACRQADGSWRIVNN